MPTSESEKIDNILKKNGNEPIISMIDAIKEAYPGISEDEAKTTQERELCVRKTQNGRVLDKNSDPPMITPESAVEMDSTGKPYVNLSGKTIVVNKGYDVGRIS